MTIGRRWCVGEERRDISLEVRSDALEATDGHRLTVDAGTTTRGLAGTVAHAPKDAGKDVGLSIE
jgi:hypothetical protein